MTDDGSGETRSEGEQNGEGGEAAGDSNEGTGTAGLALAIASAVFTVALILFVGWQIAMGAPVQEPQAYVADTETLQSGRVAVTLVLQNPTNRGLEVATVEVGCTTPPTELELSMVPADSTVTGTVVCPPGTTDPDVSIVSWVER